MVSIKCLVYNHEPYLRDCLNGFIMQNTSFKFEAIVHDDASTDGSTAIIREYAAKYPDIIKPIYEKENQYSKHDGSLSKIMNAECQGKYIAMCEGDDYWTDPLKLQKQVDFLEEHKDYSGMAHQSTVIYSNSDKEAHVFKVLPEGEKTIDQLLNHRIFHTASIMFRRCVFDKNILPNNVLSGDKALILLIIMCGRFWYSNDDMCVYRKNEGGISSWVTVEILKKDLNIIKWAKSIDKNFPSWKYRSFLHFTFYTYPPKLTIFEIIKNYFLAVLYSFSNFPKNILIIYRYTHAAYKKILSVRR